MNKEHNLSTEATLIRAELLDYMRQNDANLLQAQVWLRAKHFDDMEEAAASIKIDWEAGRL